jgi:hypothetical protein
VLLPRVAHIAGYRRFSLTRASVVVNCQSALVWFLLRSSSVFGDTKMVALQAQYAVWLEAIPSNLQDSPTADALQSICNLDVAEFQAIEPPRRVRTRLPPKTAPLPRGLHRWVHRPPARRCSSLLTGTPRRGSALWTTGTRRNEKGSFLDAD